MEIESPHFYKGLVFIFVLPLVFLFVGYMVGIFIAKLINEQEETLGYIFMGIGFFFSFFLMARLGKNCSPKYTITELAKNFS